MPFDDHQKIVEIVGNAASQAAHRFHLLRLPELLLKDVPLADVLGNNEANLPARIFQFMNRRFDLDDFSVFLPVFPVAAMQPVSLALLKVLQHP